MFYSDLTPKDINLGYHGTKNNQQIIVNLTEGANSSFSITVLRFPTSLRSRESGIYPANTKL
jgi:hypothetical protein